MLAADPPIKRLSGRVVWSCPWYQVRQDEILLPNGQSGVYHVVEHPGAVWVVPITPAGEVILIRTYRYTVDDWCWEVPAGGLQPNQSLEQLAIEELQQEIGGTAQQLHYLGWFYASNGICNEKGHVFLATGVTLNRAAPEPAEIITVHPIPPAQALAMARTGQITDGPSALALLWAEPYLKATSDNQG